MSVSLKDSDLTIQKGNTLKENENFALENMINSKSNQNILIQQEIRRKTSSPDLGVASAQIKPTLTEILKTHLGESKSNSVAERDGTKIEKQKIQNTLEKINLNDILAKYSIKIDPNDDGKKNEIEKIKFNSLVTQENQIDKHKSSQQIEQDQRPKMASKYNEMLAVIADLQLEKNTKEDQEKTKKLENEIRELDKAYKLSISAQEELRQDKLKLQKQIDEANFKYQKDAAESQEVIKKLLSEKQTLQIDYNKLEDNYSKIEIQLAHLERNSKEDKEKIKKLEIIINESSRNNEILIAKQTQQYKEKSSLQQINEKLNLELQSNLERLKAAQEVITKLQEEKESLENKESAKFSNDMNTNKEENKIQAKQSDKRITQPDEEEKSLLSSEISTSQIKSLVESSFLSPHEIKSSSKTSFLVLHWVSDNAIFAQKLNTVYQNTAENEFKKTIKKIMREIADLGNLTKEYYKNLKINTVNGSVLLAHIQDLLKKCFDRYKILEDIQIKILDGAKIKA